LAKLDLDSGKNISEWRNCLMEKSPNYDKIRERTAEYFKKANIVITPEEFARIEVADLGLNDIETIGLQLVTYVNTQRVCAKEMVLFPHQICAEHKHPTIGNVAGKEETFRCRYGKVYLYVSGEETDTTILERLPEAYKKYFTVSHKIELNPGEQYTIVPNTLHWFQSGDEGAVISEFSTSSHDETDIFTNPHVKR
jgi:D-lyxose ketol-isomerase